MDTGLMSPPPGCGSLLVAPSSELAPTSFSARSGLTLVKACADLCSEWLLSYVNLKILETFYSLQMSAVSMLPGVKLALSALRRCLC